MKLDMSEVVRRASGRGRSTSPTGTRVEKAKWGWLVICQVCGASDGFVARSSGSGAKRKADKWRCPVGACREIITLRNALRPFANHYPGHEEWPLDRGCPRFFKMSEVKAAFEALYPELVQPRATPPISKGQP